MRFGICADVSRVAMVRRAGYDYVEMGLSTIAKASEDEFIFLKEALAQQGLNAEACNVFVPGELPLTGPDVDKARITQYVERALARAAMLGAKVVVFGSGGARNCPPGFSRDAAWDQLTEFLQIAGDAGAQNGIGVAIEPLCAAECNIINTVQEALALAQNVGHAQVGVLADYYHIGQMREGMDGIRAAGEGMLHTHIAHPITRIAPAPGQEDAGYTEFFKALAGIQYDARMSVEAKLPGEDAQWEQAAGQALRTLKNLVSDKNENI